MLNRQCSVSMSDQWAYQSALKKGSADGRTRRRTVRPPRFPGLRQTDINLKSIHIARKERHHSMRY